MKVAVASNWKLVETPVTDLDSQQIGHPEHLGDMATNQLERLLLLSLLLLSLLC